MIALEASRQYAVNMGFKSYILDSELKGDVESVAEFVFNMAVRYKTIRKSKNLFALFLVVKPH